MGCACCHGGPPAGTRGLITAADILGERPATYAVERGVKRQETLVRDFPTLPERLEVLWYPEVAAAEVGHVVAALTASGRQHAMVGESSAEGAGQGDARRIFFPRKS